MVTQFIIGLATGVTVLVGRYFGEQKERKLSKATGAAIVFFGVLALILSVIYVGGHQMMVELMQTPSEAVAATKQYLFTCALGIVFIAGYNVVSSILTGLGDSKTPFLFILIACIINVVLDIVLVRYFYMGALGTAIATTIAQAGSFLFALLVLKKKGLGYPLIRQDIRLNKIQIVGMVKIGVPVAVQNVLVGVSFLFITAIINNMGVTASAAVGIVEKLITFLFVPAIAMGTAVSTAGAQNIGAGNPKRAKQGMWNGVLIALVPSVLIALFCQFGGDILAGFLSNDSEVIAMSENYLRSYIFDVVMVSFVFCMNGYFNSCGKSWFSLVHSLVTTFALRVPLAWIFAQIEGGGLYAIGWAAPLSTAVSLLLCLIFLWRMDRAGRKENVI